MCWGSSSHSRWVWIIFLTMRKEGRGHWCDYYIGVFFGLPEDLSVWRRDCLTFPWNSFINVCVVLLYGCSIPFGIETFYFGVWVKGLDAKIRTRSEEGNCLVHPAMANLAPLCFHISVSWGTLDVLQQVYISRAPMAWGHFSIVCLQDVGLELSSAPSLAKASMWMKQL